MSSSPTLREHVEELFSALAARTAGRPALAPLHQELVEARARLDQPMRVAVVGLIKAGKSTLVNAILGEEMVATGRVETTFNINWLEYGEEAFLVVHYKDGRPPERRAAEELLALTRRDDAEYEFLRSIRYIKVHHPNPILKLFHLIDTPGLESTYGDDSENTRDFLRLHGREISELTQAEASQADAVLYLFSRGLHEADRSAVEQFQGPVVESTTPINAIGVLTRVDGYWSALEPHRDPLQDGRGIASRYRNDPRVRSLFYGIYPVCGLLALGARTLTAEEFADVRQLSALEEPRLLSLCSNTDRLRLREYDDVPVPAARRARLVDRLGPYGLMLACTLVRTGTTDLEEVRAQLLERSGYPALHEVVTAHFGNRAFLIKLSSGLQRLRALCFRERQRLTGEDRRIVTEVAGTLEALRARQHVFDEMQVLRDYYEGAVDLTAEEAQQLLRVTGEFGTAAAERLGLEGSATLDEMIAAAEALLAYWRLRANDFGADRKTRRAAGVLERSYERIVYHVGEARKHLSLYG